MFSCFRIHNDDAQIRQTLRGVFLCMIRHRPKTTNLNFGSGSPQCDSGSIQSKESRECGVLSTPFQLSS